jgi:sec-independent protein translocase protein TatB
MFDIGFWEIALISIIGLVVLGPERLPTAIRSVMQWINTAKGMANSVKSEISQELKLHEMNENMIKANKNGLDSLDPELKKSIDEMKKSAQELINPYKSTVEDLQETLTIEPENKTPEKVSEQEKAQDSAEQQEKK